MGHIPLCAPQTSWPSQVLPPLCPATQGFYPYAGRAQNRAEEFFDVINLYINFLISTSYILHSLGSDTNMHLVETTSVHPRPVTIGTVHRAVPDWVAQASIFKRTVRNVLGII